MAADCVALRRGPRRAVADTAPAQATAAARDLVLLLERAGALLFERRPATRHLGGLWSFPEIDVDADVAAAMRARFGVDAAVTGEMPPSCTRSRISR